MSGNRPSLAEAFAPGPSASTRGTKLEGLLPPKRRTTEGNPAATVTQPSGSPALTTAPEPTKAPDPAPATETEQTTADPATPPKPVPAPRVSRQQSAKRPAGQTPTSSRPKTSDTVPGAPRNVGVYLAPQLLAAVKEAVYRDRSTYADLLIDAFETLEDARLAQEFEPESVLTNSGMPRRAVRRRGSAGIQIQVRLDDTQIAWLDQKVVEFDAPSRSALVSAAYKLHLSQEKSTDTGE